MKPLQHDLVVLFDRGGTVVDSETIALKSAWRLTNEVAREFPGAQHYELEDFVKSFAGKPYREILKKLYPDSYKRGGTNQPCRSSSVGWCPPSY
jgi:beta-phosphoglucomutase-like phosphatase (HAD superfamily)